MLIAPCELCGKRRVLFDLGNGAKGCMTCRRREQCVADGGKFVNQHGEANGQRNAYPGERHGPLDPAQVRRFFALAGQAFERMHGRKASASEMESWRHEHQEKACGVRSLLVTTQAHWPALEAYFLDLAGASDQAFERLMCPDAGRLRIALAVLRRELRGAKLEEGYAAAICQGKFHCPLDQATAKQIWQVIFTVRNRGIAKRAKRARATTQDLPF